MKKVLSSLIASFLIFLMFIPNIQAGEMKKIQHPIIFLDTCDAISSDFLDSLCNMYDIKYDWAGNQLNIPSVQQLSSGTGFPGFDMRQFSGFSYAYSHTFKSGVPDGTPYKTIVFIIGVAHMSLYWMNDIHLNAAFRRIESIIKWAKENEVTIVGMHLDGEFQRGFNVDGHGIQENEKLIDMIAPECDVLIVNSYKRVLDGNFDGKFTGIAEENNIDLYTVDFIDFGDYSLPLSMFNFYSPAFNVLKSLIEE